MFIRFVCRVMRGSNSCTTCQVRYFPLMLDIPALFESRDFVKKYENFGLNGEGLFASRKGMGRYSYRYTKEDNEWVASLSINKFLSSISLTIFLMFVPAPLREITTIVQLEC